MSIQMCLCQFHRSQMLAKMAGRQEKPDYKTATMEAFNIEGFESKNPKPTQVSCPLMLHLGLIGCFCLAVCQPLYAI